VPPEICPNCGEPVPPGAHACPACGSDDKTGWSEEARTDSLDLPEEKFDYDDFVAREFGDRRPVPRGVPLGWWLVAAAVTVAFVLLILRR